MFTKITMKRHDENGAALMIAILVMVVILALITSITASIIVGTQKSGETRDYTFFSLAADTALNDALLTANSQVMSDGVTSIINHVGPENAKTGTLSPNESGNADINWRWYALPSPSTAPYTDYQIYASGYRGTDYEADNAYHITARLNSFGVTSYSQEDDVVTYRLPARSLYSKGIIGFEGIALEDNASAYYYNSAGGTTPPMPTTSTPRAALHTNNDIAYRNFGGYAAGVNIYNFGQEDIIDERCDPTCILPSTMHGYGIKLASPHEDSTIDHSRQETCNSSSWNSAFSGTMLMTYPGTNHYCVQDMKISADTFVPSRFTTGAPMTLFVKGNLTMEPGTKLRSAGYNDPARGPMALRIVVDGNVVIKGHPTLPTELSALVISRGECSISDPGMRAEVRGTIACSSLDIRGNGTVWVDEQARMTEAEQGPVGSGSGEDHTRAWSLSRYEIINSLPEQG